MYVTVSKRGGPPRIDLANGKAQRAIGPASIEVVLEGDFGRASGIDLRHTNDASALANLYAAHGVSGLEKVDGSFAFAIIDHQRGRVHAGIDKLGQSFAYIAETVDSVHFATTLKELLDLLPSR